MNGFSKILLVFFVAQFVRLSLPAYVFSDPSALKNETVLRERFFSESPVQLNRYREKYFDCNGTLKFKSTHVTSGRVENLEGGSVIRGNRKCKLIQTELPDGSQTAMGSSPDYLFLVKRKHSNDIWYLDQLQIKLPPRTMKYDPEFVDGRGDNVNNLHLNFQSTCGAGQLTIVSGMNFAQMIQSDEFELQSIKPNLNPLFVEASISYVFHGVIRIEGTVVMCPDQYWTIRHYDLDVFRKDNGEFKLYGKQTFESTVTNEDSFVLPVSTTLKAWSFDGQNETTRQKSYEMSEASNLTNSECRLRAFGIPEPPGLQVGVHPFVYISFAVIFLIIIGLVIRRTVKAPQ